MFREPLRSLKTLTKKEVGIVALLFLALVLRFLPLVKEKEKSAAKVAVSGCHSSSNQVECWDSLIATTLKKESLDNAFTVFGDLYESEPNFAASCHGFAHSLGLAAYKDYAAGKDFSLSNKTSYCGYGFYHGFMETLLLSTHNPKKAVDFCNFVGKKLQGQNNDAYGACFHGIGHGTVDGSNPGTWGDPGAVVKPGLEMCEKIAGDDKTQFGPLYRCVTGAYNALEILSANPKYQLSAFRAQPFSFCDEQKEVYKEACYTNMLPALLANDQNNFSKIAETIAGISEVGNSYDIRGSVVMSLFYEFYRVNLNNANFADTGVALCRSLPSLAHFSCIEGLAGGLMKYGSPGKEYVKALALCGDKILDINEKDACYSRLLAILGNWYTASKVVEICNQAPGDYRHYCSEKTS